MHRFLAVVFVLGLLPLVAELCSLWQLGCNWGSVGQRLWYCTAWSSAVCGDARALIQRVQVSADEFRMSRLHSAAYQRLVSRELLPSGHTVEEFVLALDWEQLHPQSTERQQQRTEPHVRIVLLLQCTPDRLPIASVSAQRWRGPIALAIFIPAPRGTPAASHCRDATLRYLQHAAGMHGEFPLAVSFVYALTLVPTVSCNVSSNLTGAEEVVVDEDSVARSLAGQHWTAVWRAEYPFNLLRSVSRSMVRDDAFVFLLDVDFVTPHNLHATLSRGSTRASLLRMQQAWHEARERHALILPAFERFDHGEPAAASGTGPLAASRDNRAAVRSADMQECAADSASVNGSSPCFLHEGLSVPLSKAVLKAMLAAGEASVFHSAQFPVGHACYRPQEWLAADQMYAVEYTNPCEPYFVALNAALPPFDTRFTGRNRDKVAILTAMAALSTQFQVHPELFVVHLPHPKGTSLAAHSTDPVFHSNFGTAHFVLTHVLLRDAIHGGDSGAVAAMAHHVRGVGQVWVRQGKRRRLTLWWNGVCAATGLDGAAWVDRPCRVDWRGTWKRIVTLALILSGLTVIGWRL